MGVGGVPGALRGTSYHEGGRGNMVIHLLSRELGGREMLLVKMVDLLSETAEENYMMYHH